LTAPVDVRSAPYSRRNPRFNRETIKRFLSSCGITYVFMGDLLGARYSGTALFFEGTRMVDFSKVRATGSFKRGIDRLCDGIAGGHRIALMCAEKDPFDCHRFVLVSPALAQRGIEVTHILADGSLVPNAVLEDRLLEKYSIRYHQKPLFETPRTREQALAVAYERRNRDIGYVHEEGPALDT